MLLRELASAPSPGEATAFPQATPLLHTLSAVHAYIMMLVHVCRTGQTEIRQVSINQWGTELGLRVLAGLTQLYTSLVWESTVLLALCSDDALPAGCLFGKEDTDKLLPPDLRVSTGVEWYLYIFIYILDILMNGQNCKYFFHFKACPV